MDKITLKSKTRKKEDEKNKDLIPAIFYGRGIESVSLWLDKKEFDKVYHQAGESTLVELQIEEKNEPETILVYDVQYDPISDEPRHVDLYRVKMDEEIETDVGLIFEGIAPAVKELGGVLVKSIDSVSVKCLPADLPHEIKVDISKIETFNDHIYIKDLPISDKVKIELDPETVIALVSPPRTDKEMESLDEEVEADVSSVEGIAEKEEAAGEKDEDMSSKEGSAEKEEDKKE